MEMKSRLETKLDLTSYINDASQSAVLTTMEALKEAWIKEAKSRLNSTADAYISSIKSRVTTGSSPSAEIYLDGSWANKLENGFQSYDMKPFFSRSSKRKISEQTGQWYLHIPFRHTTPSATGKTGSSMPNSVYNIARRLPTWGKLQTSSGSLGKYEGLTKVPESKSGIRSAYYTWRTVSENSAPSAFIHPGFSGVHIAQGLASQIGDTFSKVFMSNMDYSLNHDKG